MLIRVGLRKEFYSPECVHAANAIANMYCRLLEKRKIKHSSRIRGDEIEIVAEQDVPQLKQEAGIHRYVDFSKFDPEKRRHTVFIQVSIDDYSPECPIVSYIMAPYQRVAIRDGAGETRFETKEIEQWLDGSRPGHAY
jgi:hypothetical protein